MWQNTDEAKVDIFVVTFNHPLWIEKCIESLTKQDFRHPFNIYIYDDKSSKRQTIHATYRGGGDGTRAGNIKALSSKVSSRLTFDNAHVEKSDTSKQILWRLRKQGFDIDISHENQGVSVARNYIAKRGQAPLILFVDGDDWLDEMFLEKAWRRMMIAKSDIVYPKIAIVVEGPGLAEHGAVNQCEFDRLTLMRTNYMPVTSLMKRIVFEELQGFDEEMKGGFEDWEFWIRAALNDYKFVFEPEAILYYRQHEAARSHQANQNAQQIVEYIKNKHSKAFENAFRPKVEFLNGEEKVSDTEWTAEASNISEV